MRDFPAESRREESLAVDVNKETFLAQQAESERVKAGLWLSFIRRGRWEEAWSLIDRFASDARTRSASSPPALFAQLWDGAPLDGRRVLVRCLHGLGDSLTHLRYAPFVRRVAASLCVLAQPSLVPLLSCAPDLDEVLALHEGTPEPPFDVELESFELNHWFRPTPATVPPPLPLVLGPVPPRTDTAFRVGVVWRASSWNIRRNVAFDEFVRLAEGIPARFFALQQYLVEEEERGPFEITPERLETLSTAQFMRTLDLVITIDSMPAHLAGMLGVPVWMLVPSDPDWRWVLDGEQTPWYPSMRIFRQRTTGDWGPVIADVRRELLALTGRK